MLSWTQAAAALVEEARGRSSASGTPTVTATPVPASAESALRWRAAAGPGTRKADLHLLAAVAVGSRGPVRHGTG